MASTRMYAILVAVAVAFASASVALAQDRGPPQGHQYFPPFMPLGHAYAPGDDQLPPIDSLRSQFNSRVDILQTEVYRRNFDRRMFESEMHRHDLRGGPLVGPNY